MTDADKIESIERDIERLDAEIVSLRKRVHSIANVSGRASDLTERVEAIEVAIEALPWRVAMLEKVQWGAVALALSCVGLELFKLLEKKA